MEEGFRPYLRGINKWDKTVRKELRTELRASGEMIASGSRLLAAAHSKSIPPTIKVRTGIQSERAEVQIRAGGGNVPIAGLFELGNKGGGKSKAGATRKKFRHPLFGDKGKWYEQDMHPYIAPMVRLRQAAVTKRVKSAVERANRTLVKL